MAEEILKVARSENYLTLTLNRPEKRNALNQPLIQALDRALAGIENDKAVRAVLVRGAGRSFCAGLDLQEVDRMESGRGASSLEDAFRRLENLPVPTIAAVNGAALAGGLELALHCDLRVAADNARLGMTLARVGLVVPFNLARKLIEVIGSAATAQLLFSAEPVDARCAYEMGMVNEIVPEAGLDEAAGAWAAKIASNAPLALRAMKATIRRCVSAAYDADHADVDQMAAAARRSQDAREGVRAFLEKRKPVWRAE